MQHALFAAAAAVVVSAPALAQFAHMEQFNLTPSGGFIHAIGLDADAQRVLYHRQNAPQLARMDFAGEAGDPVPFAPGVGGNGDIDVVHADAVLGGVTLRRGDVLFFQGHQTPARVYGVSAGGEIVAQLNFAGPSGVLIGGAIAPDGTLVVLDTSSEFVRRLDPATGQQVGSFPVGNGDWNTTFGDIDVSLATGNIYAVSHNNDRMRIFSPEGAIVADYDLRAAFGVVGLTGVAIDDVRGEAWFSTSGGIVHRVSGLPSTEFNDADANDDGHVNVNDLLAFLTAFSASSAAGDFNRDGSVTVQDLLAFLAAFANA